MLIASKNADSKLSMYSGCSELYTWKMKINGMGHSTATCCRITLQKVGTIEKGKKTLKPKILEFLIFFRNLHRGDGNFRKH